MRDLFHELSDGMQITLILLPFILLGAAIGYGTAADRIPVKAETTQASQPTEHGQYAEVTYQGQTATVKVPEAKPAGAPVMTGWDPSAGKIVTDVHPAPNAVIGGLVGTAGGFLGMLAVWWVLEAIDRRREPQAAWG